MKKFTTDTFFLMRVDSPENIDRDFYQNRLTFSCPANWLDYALKQNDETIGDRYECIFAHLDASDERRLNVKNSHGELLQDQYSITCKSDNTVLLRLETTILTPALCFWSLPLQKILSSIKTSSFDMDLDVYLKNMNRKAEDSKLLMITDCDKFFSELKKQIPIAVKNNCGNLTSEGFGNAFNPTNPFLFKHVCYDQFDKDTLFFRYNEYLDEMFWKLPSYDVQSELRIVLPKINFRQKYGDGTAYDYTKNSLSVELPGLHDYARTYSLKEIRYLNFSNYASAKK